jgi:hypothetical protein
MAYFFDHRPLSDILASLPPSTGTLSVSYDGSSFAILAFQQKPAGDNLPHLSLNDLEDIATICGWVLSSLGEKAVQQTMWKRRISSSDTTLNN